MNKKSISHACDNLADTPLLAMPIPITRQIKPGKNKAFARGRIAKFIVQ